MNQPVNLTEDILMNVEKPVRYIGSEYNAIHKNHEETDVSVCLAFPDVYEIAMSHLGLKILYHLLNERNDVTCERVFSPWIDMENTMRKENIPLFSLESGYCINNFDILGFTLQYEMSYTNILNMLSLGKIPVEAAERTKEGPLVIAGGPCAFNPEPLASFIDVFHIGESEEAVLEIVDVYKDWKMDGGLEKQELLSSLSKLNGIYVPKFYHISYNDMGIVKDFVIKNDAPEKINKRIVSDLDNTFYPKEIIVPFMQTVHDRIPLEVARGCTRGCRFCHAGIIYRPVRERSKEKLIEYAEALIENTGYEELSLLSLSISDYSDIENLIRELMDKHASSRLSISLPSLRADSFSVGLAKQVQRVKKTGFTFAPEAGTQRLRNVINKCLTEDEVLSSVQSAVDSGWSLLKLYFMIGLPTEMHEDIEGIVNITKQISGYKKRLKVNVSASTFVPKAHTPFQWEKQDSLEVIKGKQEYLREQLNGKGIKFSWHDPKTSMIEGVFSRGDRRLNKVLFSAWQRGCKFDSWSEHFRYNTWMQAFEETGVNPGGYVYRERDIDEVLPWDHINTGVSKGFLINEREKARKAETTMDCRREKCHKCGVC